MNSATAVRSHHSTGCQRTESTVCARQHDWNEYRHHRCKPITADFNGADDLRLRPRMSCRNTVYGTVWWCYHSRGSIGHNVCTPSAQSVHIAEDHRLSRVFFFFFFFAVVVTDLCFSDRRSKGASSNGRICRQFPVSAMLVILQLFHYKPFAMNGARDNQSWGDNRSVYDF